MLRYKQEATEAAKLKKRLEELEQQRANGEVNGGDSQVAELERKLRLAEEQRDKLKKKHGEQLQMLAKKVLTRVQGGQEAVDEAAREEKEEKERRAKEIALREEKLRREEMALEESTRKAKEAELKAQAALEKVAQVCFLHKSPVLPWVSDLNMLLRFQAETLVLAAQKQAAEEAKTKSSQDSLAPPGAFEEQQRKLSDLERRLQAAEIAKSEVSSRFHPCAVACPQGTVGYCARLVDSFSPSLAPMALHSWMCCDSGRCQSSISAGGEDQECAEDKSEVDLVIRRRNY